MNMIQLGDRLKAHYSDCEITQTENMLFIRLPLGEARVTDHHAAFFVAGKPFNELDKEGDELYEAVEAFILALRNDEEQCNPTFLSAQEHVQKQSNRLIKIMGVLFVLTQIASIRFSHPIFFAGVFLIPVLLFVFLRLIRLHIFRKDWVCPHCGAQLPMKPKKFFPLPQHSARCPECGVSLLDSSLIEEIRQLLLFEEEEEDTPGFESAPVLSPQGGKGFCIFSGILFLLCDLLFVFMMAVQVAEESPAALALNILDILLVAAAAIALFVCRASKDERQPLFVIREQKFLSGLGTVINLIGLFFVLMGICMSTENLTSTFLFSFLGLFLLLIGAWMLLARKNRSLSIFSDSVRYVTSFGKTREWNLSQISAVRLTNSHSIHFLDSCEKKLFAVEGNMVGTEYLFDWLEQHHLPVKTTKALDNTLNHDEAAAAPAFWHEEDRTSLHDHLGAIRIGLIFTVLLFIAGCILPLVLYMTTDLKIVHTIYLTAFSPLPLLLYYLAFAPVLLIKDRPKDATDEWNALHIKFPTMLVLIFCLLYNLQIYHIWDSSILQVVDNGRFLLLALVFAVVLIAAFYMRTPRRLREPESLFMISLSLIFFAYGLAYGTSLVLCKPVEHYPAVVVAREKADPDDKDTQNTLTILLDDGKPADLNVSDQLYDMEEAGTEFVVCQKENFLGIRMVRLHLPKADEVPGETH